MVRMKNVTFDLVDVSEILAFRQAMLWPNKPLDHVSLAEDDTATHICARLDQKIIAAGSFFLNNDAARLRKLAVDPEFRGQRLGAELVTIGSQRMIAEGAKVLWCDARVESVGFYERLGFEVDQSVFEKDGALYRRASRQLR